MLNNLTKNVFESLHEYYSMRVTPRESFCKQLELVNRQINFTTSLVCYKESLKALNNIFKCKNLELCDGVSRLLYEMDSNKTDEVLWSQSRQALSTLLFN
jgi:hypothetical protein